MLLGISTYTPAWSNIAMMVVALLALLALMISINRVPENKPVPKMMMVAAWLHIILLVLNLGLFANNMIQQAEVQQLKAKEMAIQQ